METVTFLNTFVSKNMFFVDFQSLMKIYVYVCRWMLANKVTQKGNYFKIWWIIILGTIQTLYYLVTLCVSHVSSGRLMCISRIIWALYVHLSYYLGTLCTFLILSWHFIYISHIILVFYVYFSFYVYVNLRNTCMLWWYAYLYITDAETELSKATELISGKTELWTASSKRNVLKTGYFSIISLLGCECLYTHIKTNVLQHES